MRVRHNSWQETMFYASVVVSEEAQLQWVRTRCASLLHASCCAVTCHLIRLTHQEQHV